MTNALAGAMSPGFTAMLLRTRPCFELGFFGRLTPTFGGDFEIENDLERRPLIGVMRPKGYCCHLWMICPAYLGVEAASYVSAPGASLLSPSRYI
jgi:hypothetical protein